MPKVAEQAWYRLNTPHHTLVCYQNNTHEDVIIADVRKQEVADLIAAAPEMLEALKLAETALIEYGNKLFPHGSDAQQFSLMKLLAAIAKAEGRNE